MSTWKRWYVLIVGAALCGCTLLGPKPTPLPWLPTATPRASAEAQLAPTATPALDAANPTHTPGSLPAQTPTPPPTELPHETATPVLTQTPATTTPPNQTIALEVPISGQLIGNPVTVRGYTQRYPFEGTLVIRVFDGRNQLCAEAPVIADGEYGQAATFAASIAYGGIPGPGRVEVLEFSPRDGSVTASAVQQVILAGLPGGGYVELPEPLATVTLPLGVLARVGAPGQQVRASVIWADGTRISSTHTLLQGPDDQGLLALSLGFQSPGASHPPTQAATVEVATLEGSPLAWQSVWLLHPDDPATMATNVFWVRDGEVVPQTLRVPRTQGIGRASLERLLWGPVPGNREGFTSAIPSAAQVLSYPGRDGSWGERVVLKSLVIVNGVAEADFSIELNAHSGGAEQVVQIRQQIEATLRQFRTISDVSITVNGQPALLEP